MKELVIEVATVTSCILSMLLVTLRSNCLKLCTTIIQHTEKTEKIEGKLSIKVNLLKSEDLDLVLAGIEMIKIVLKEEDLYPERMVIETEDAVAPESIVAETHVKGEAIKEITIEIEEIVIGETVGLAAVEIEEMSLARDQMLRKASPLEE